MTKNLVISALAAAALIEGCTAFAPVQNCDRSTTSLNAERREVLGNFAKILGAGAIIGGTTQSSNNAPELLAGLTNPAQESWRGKYKGQSFTPGKGMRNHEDLMAGLTNPAQESWRGKYKGQSFTPGKGMRNHEDLA